MKHTNHTNHTEREAGHAEKVRLANEAVAAHRDAAQGDRYRLSYHFMPPAGWMNDPNGLIYFKEEYHLFYQHHPYSDKNGPMHWGHAKSGNLTHWEHLPIALAPSEPYDLGQSGGYGCWSGSAVEQDGKLVLLYTGHVDGRTPEEVQCMATSADGIHFEKYAHNPVIDGNPDGECFGFRDPKAWKHGEHWYMVIGSGKNGRGRALLYQSADLRQWQYVGVAAESDGTHGEMWECPDLFPLGDKHVLIVSPMNMGTVKNYYFVGEMDYATGVFTPESQGKLDDGFDFYAAQTMPGGQGRRILLGWMDMWGNLMSAENRGWYGAMTLPRELALMADGTVGMRPVEELRLLRKEGISMDGVELADGAAMAWPRPDAFEMELTCELAEASKAQALELRLTGDGEHSEEELVIRYEFASRRLTMDRSRAGIGDGGISETIVPETTDGRLKLHLFVDTSSVELFMNDGAKTITNRVYPKAASRSLQVRSVGGTVTLSKLSLWNLAL